MLAPDVVGLELELPRFDLSLESRRTTQNAVVHDAARAVREHGLGLKAATVTPEGAGERRQPETASCARDRRHVIVRTGRRIPGVVPIGGAHFPISVVRWRRRRLRSQGVARGRRRGRGRLPPRGSSGESAARWPSFVPARRAHKAKSSAGRSTRSPHLRGHAQGGDGRRGRAPRRRRVRAAVIDATFALLISSAGEPLVIPALNRDGDILSDLVLPLFGSIAGQSRSSSRSTTTTRRGRSWPRPRRDGARAQGEECREPDGDDPRDGGAALAHRRRGGAHRRPAIREPASRRFPRGPARPTSAGTPQRRSTRTR